MIRIMLRASTAIVLGIACQTGIAAAAGALSFTGIAAPTSDQDKRQVLAASEVTVGGTTAKIGYHTLLRTGQTLGGGVFGQVLDQHGQPIPGANGAPMISESTDFSSILQKNGKLYIVSHFETRPAAAYLTEVTADPATGLLTPVSTAAVDFSGMGGLWVPCAGSVTPWGTHLGSEEYEPDARVVEEASDIAKFDEYYKPMSLYFGYDMAKPGATLDGFRAVVNPYAYGYITEIAVDDAGRGQAAKHYAIGRFSHELGYVMPDRKTVYLSDDGTNVGLYRFVADQADKLDAGTLYAARFQQTSADNGGSFDLAWVDLGHATSAEVRGLIDKGTKFSDLFETAKLDKDGKCTYGFSPSLANGVPECLKVKPGMELAASRLETRRYATVMGATTEIRKEEGVTYDPDHHKLYVAISEISRGMEDMAKGGKSSDKYDLPSTNHIKLPYNPCGGVYALDLDDAFVAKSMTAMVLGTPKTYAAGEPYAGNTCDIDGLASPDNLSYLPGKHTLFIGEDTEEGHQNDAVWAYNLDDKKLTRILTTPYGAETTSVYAYPNIGGHGYLMSIVQHPYGESDQDKLQSPDDAQAYLGYVGPLPRLD